MLVTCTKCGKVKPPSSFSPDKRKKNGLSSWCKECNRKRIRKLHYQLRLGILEKLGGTTCKQCGFKDVRALQIDHIHGGGFQEFKEKDNRTTYREIRDMPIEEALKKYQVLCANCNWIKKSELREVPNFKG